MNIGILWHIHITKKIPHLSRVLRLTSLGPSNIQLPRVCRHIQAEPEENATEPSIHHRVTASVSGRHACVGATAARHRARDTRTHRRMTRPRPRPRPLRSGHHARHVVALQSSARPLEAACPLLHVRVGAERSARGGAAVRGAALSTRAHHRD